MYAHAPRCVSFILYPLSFILVLACSSSTDPNSENSSPRERVTVSGPISEDTVWEFGKEYVVTGDVMVEAGATLSLLDPSRDPAGCRGEVCA